MRRICLALAALLLTSCNTAPLTSAPEGNVDIGKILEEVNSAITRSIPADPDFPALTSISLDMQVSTTSTISASVPVNVVSITPSVDSSKLHRVVIDFVPTAARQPSSLTSISSEEAQLTAAIGALYQSVSHASNVYKLQRGSISLQCVLKAQAGAGLKLIPLSANIAASRQVTQLLTINFGRDPNRFILQNEAGGSRASGGTTNSTRTTTTPATTPATTVEAPTR